MKPSSGPPRSGLDESLLLDRHWMRTSPDPEFRTAFAGLASP